MVGKMMNGYSGYGVTTTTTATTPVSPVLSTAAPAQSARTESVPELPSMALPPIGSKWWPRLAHPKPGVVEVIGYGRKLSRTSVQISRNDGMQRTSYLLDSFHNAFVPYNPERHTETHKGQTTARATQSDTTSDVLAVSDDGMRKLSSLARKYEAIALRATGIAVTVRVEDVLAKVLELGLAAAKVEVRDE